MPGVGLLPADVRRRGQVLHPQRPIDAVRPLLAGRDAALADDQRGVPRAEEAGAERRLAEDAERRDADEVRAAPTSSSPSSFDTSAPSDGYWIGPCGR